MASVDGVASFVCFFLFYDTSTTEIYTLSLHDALPILAGPHHGRAEGDEVGVGRSAIIHIEKVEAGDSVRDRVGGFYFLDMYYRSEEHTSELQSRENLVCRLLLEKKKKKQKELLVNIVK